MDMESNFVPVISDEGEYSFRGSTILCIQRGGGHVAYIPLTPSVCRRFNIPDSFAASGSSVIDMPSTSWSAVPESAPIEEEIDAASLPPPKTKWTVAATRALISIYKEKRFLFETRLKNDRVWEIMAEEMAKENYSFSSLQVRNRFQNLKRAYGKKKDGLKKTGSSPVRFDYWEEFEELFSKDHSVTPIRIGSNMRPIPISIERDGGEPLETDNEAIPETVESPAPRNRKRKSDFPLLEEIKLMREERAARWEERKELMEQEAATRSVLLSRQMEEIRQGREVFKSLMERLLEKL